MSTYTANASVPMYHQIAQVLRRRLEAGDLGATGQLATEHELCEEFGVSRTTVRHALSYLKREGLLSSRRGVGTRRVATEKRKKYVRSSGDPLHAALSSKPRVISLAMAQAPAPVASFLGVAEDAQVLKLVRVHELDGEPLSVVMTYMPSQLAAGISRGALRESLHEILWHRFGLKQQRSLHTIRIARADTDVAQLLRVGLADPVMNIQSSTFLQDGRPIRWTENFFREDRYEYTAEFIWDRPPARQRPAGTATKAKGKK